MYLRDIWPTTAEIKQVVDACVEATMFTAGYADVFAGDDNWRGMPMPRLPDVHLGSRLDLRAPAAVLRRHATRTRDRCATSPGRGCWPSSATR